MTTDAPPRISVIVPAYGVAHLVGEALASLQAQSCPSWEAIVVDDGAPDDVEGALRRFWDDPRIRLLRTDNGGVSRARNRASALARSEWLAFLDGDDIYGDAYVATMLDAIRADPGTDFFTCDAAYFGKDRKEQLFSAFHPQHLPVSLGTVLSRECNIFIGSALRKSAFLSVGGFDEGLGAAEDFDLWLRLLAAGHAGALIPRPLVRYRRRAGSLSSDGPLMLDALCRVYEKQVATLAGRPERDAALLMLARARRERGWRQGEDLILAGKTRQGLALLDGAEDRSARWRCAMRILHRFPSLAKPMLKMREIIPEPMGATRHASPQPSERMAYSCGETPEFRPSPDP